MTRESKSNNINFRITPENMEKLEYLKQQQEIQNISAFMNRLILEYKDLSRDHVSIRTIPEEGLQIYRNPKTGLEESVRLYSKSFSQLSIKKHAEARKVIEDNGMGYFYFPINKDLSMAIIACNKEEASILFQRYFIYDKASKEYVRTGLSLPQYRYDLNDKNIIIIEYGD